MRNQKTGFQFILILLCLFLPWRQSASAQCCAGGSGSPIAGGASQGVLLERQVELNTNFQFITTDKFFSKDSPDSAKYFDRFHSTYQYFRLAYGVTKHFTMSVETGNYLEKEEIGLHNNPATTYSSKGIGDLILFPRYDLINLTEEKKRTELTVGLGYKIPLGSYNDSTGNVEPFSGTSYYVTNPQAVQLTSGAQDVIFYLFLFRGYPQKNWRFFCNGFYIKKGWNPLGEKMGDFASVGLFAGKTFFDKLGVTLQLRGEWMDKMQLNKNILLYAYPNYDPEATGYKKVFFTPQLSFTKGKFTVYGLYDLPVYQYVTKTQVGSELQVTVGLSFRFFAVRSVVTDGKSSVLFSCPMHPEITSSKPASCPKCGMDLEKIK
ncbi:MAG: hypothetical protein IPG90_14115 [Bacteroidetes bacterium]|nr:hypothetical protein [Bacteroidota bacterium]MBP6401306.1 hypothetical protein [Bacteroidia bacterium]MBK6839245.1 hypothetical protein [Bacteroidota bacterium]MBK9524344.1 hypothetical protein [Bacteroidota bacterium]MBK9543585.1 hypothetical protein [Bacteroidota bacterium]